MTNLTGPFIIVGDLNAKHSNWHSSCTNKSGRTLAKHEEEKSNYCIVASESPTHYPYVPAHRPDVLDIFILKIPLLNHILTNHCDLSSDHNPQILSLNIRPTTLGIPGPRKRVNWKTFKEKLTSKINIKRIKNIQDINENIKNLTNNVRTALEDSSHLIENPEVSKRLPNEILLEIDTKPILRKNWQRTRDPKVKTLYNAQVTYVKNLLTKHRQDEWNSFTSTLNFQNKSIYKLNRRLLHKTPASQPLKAPDGTKIFDSKPKAELFANTMMLQFQNN